ncbi:MAG: tetratricopeptide repeat protein [Sphingomicrobium sp.]
MATLGMSEAEREAIAQFDRDVVQPSMASLVLLQFTAEWCGPCKQLSPTLDKVASDYAGKGVKLVRIDVDKDKMIAAQFRVQSVPTVYAFYQGQPVVDMTSYRSEGQITKVLDQILAQLKLETEEPPQADVGPLLTMAEELLAEGDAVRAASVFGQIREMAPENEDAVGGELRALVAAGSLDEARALALSLSDDLAKRPSVARAKAALELAEAASGHDHSELLDRVSADPTDHRARFELAGALASSGDRDRAADELLTIIRNDREWNDGAARARFLQLLEAQGLADPWSREQRRRLSALLFT